MKTQIETLRQRFGTYREVAQRLEITERYLMRIKSGEGISRALEYRIRREAEECESRAS